MPEGTDLTPTPAETPAADSAVMALLHEVMGVVTNLMQKVEALAPVEPAAEADPDPEADSEKDAALLEDDEPTETDPKELEELDSLLHED